jgi:hypothetical protein
MWGGDITIFGGPDWTLDLRSLTPGALEASRNIILSVGNQGVVDLRGNDSQIIWANMITIETNHLLLDPGITLPELISGTVRSRPGRIRGDASGAGPGQASTAAGTSLPLSLTLSNNGPLRERYRLSWTGPTGWNLAGLPATVGIEGLEALDLSLNIVPPATAKVGIHVITVTAWSLVDPSRVAVIRFEVKVEAQTYLPMIVKKRNP